MTTTVINRCIEFGDVLAPKIGRIIIETFRDLVKACVATVEKESSSSVGWTYTIEQRSTVSAQIAKMFENQFPLPPLVEFTGMRGGVSATAIIPAPSRQQLEAYAPLVKRLTPLWKLITTYRRDYPDTWERDVLRLPEVEKLKSEELSAMKDVINSMPYGRSTFKGSGAEIRPSTCSREHARRVLDISERGDKKLLDIETESKKLAGRVGKRPASRRRARPN